MQKLPSFWMKPFRGLSIQWYLVLFGIGIVLPVLIATAVVAIGFASKERERYHHDAVSMAGGVAEDLDLDLNGAIGAIQVLSTSRSLRRNDFANFDAQAREVLKFRGSEIAIRDLSGQLLVNTGMPFGTVLPPNPDPAVRRVDRATVETKRPVISDILVGAVSHLHFMLVNVPVLKDDEVVYVSDMAITPDHVLQVLMAREIPPDWVITVFDGNYRVIARSKEQERFFETFATPKFQREATRTEGTLVDANQDGVSVSDTYARLRLANWRVNVAVPTSVLDAPFRHSLLLIAALTALGLCISILLAFAYGKRLARPVLALAASATALGHGETVAPIPGGITEINQVSQALSQASINLKNQIAIRDAAEISLRASEERVRHMTELALEQSEERFGLLVENIRDYGILMLDLDGRITSWNKGAQRIKGYSADEIIGRHFSCFYPEEDVASGKPARELAIAAAEGRYEEEGWRLRKDGTRFWANVIVAPIRDKSGTLTGFSKVTRDLSGERRAERKFRDLLEAAPDAIIIVNQAGDIVIVNSQAERLFGYARTELIGGKIELLLPERCKNRHPSHREGFFAAPQARPMGNWSPTFWAPQGRRRIPDRDQSQSSGDRRGHPRFKCDPRHYRTQAT